MDREEIGEAFKENADVIRRGTSKTTYYTHNERKLNPRTEATPNDINTSEKIMEIAIGQGIKVYENPVQLAFAMEGFENWCIEKNVAPSYAELAYYLNISKDTLISYTHDKTEFTCYVLTDIYERKYIYSSNDREIFDKYTENHFSFENEKSVSFAEKVKNGDYKIEVKCVTFAETFAPIKNLLEMVNINKAEVARNPAWHIFLAKNNFGRTTQYVDQVQQQITVNNPLDEMSDEEILKAVEKRPSE